MIPGSNLLAAAFTMVAAQPFDYQPYQARTVNGVGLYETTYGARVTLEGSIQAVPRNVYQEYGLDLQKNYVRVFVSLDVVDITRDTSGDRIFWNGREYQITSQVDWFNIDGWVSFIAVDVGPDPNPTPERVFDFTFSEVFA